MAKLIFNIDEDVDKYREAGKIEFVVPDDMDIYEFKIVCVRLASALGYTSKSIKNAFGELDYTKEADTVFFNEWLSDLKNNYITKSLNTGSIYEY
jgi:hypothetical protein